MFELKQKEISVDKANLAAVCAGMLQSLLTHKKVQLTKEGVRLWMLSMIFMMDQFAEEGVDESASKQSFASPSMMILVQVSEMANWAAQKIAMASAWIGEHKGIDFAQTSRMSQKRSSYSSQIL